MAQALSYALPRSLNKPLYTHFSIGGLGLGRRQADWRSPLQEKKIGRAASALHAHRQASVVSRYTTLVKPLKLCIGPDFYAGFITGAWRVKYHLVKRKIKALEMCACVLDGVVGKIWFPYSALFRCVALTTAIGAYCGKPYRCIVGWLVVGSPRSWIVANGVP